MRIVSNSRGTAAVLSTSDAKLLDRIAGPLVPLVKLKQLGYYRTMSPADVWWSLVGQVCVMGSASLWEKAERTSEAKAVLCYDTVRHKPRPQHYLEISLEALSATRFYPQAAKKLAHALASPAIFDGNRVALFDGLSHRSDPHTLRSELRNRWKTFGSKSASDFMISVGLSHDVLALDSRIIGFLEEHFGLDPASHRIRSNADHYDAVEETMRDYCRQRGFSLAQLDRVLFQFSSQSVIRLLADHPKLRLVH